MQVWQKAAVLLLILEYTILFSPLINFYSTNSQGSFLPLLFFPPTSPVWMMPLDQTKLPLLKPAPSKKPPNKIVCLANTWNNLLMCALQHANSSFKTHHFYFLFSQSHMHISIWLLISMSSYLINSAVRPYQMHYWSPCRWHTEHFLKHHLSHQWQQDRLMQFTSAKPMSTFIPFSIYFHVFNYTVLQNAFESLADDRGQTNSSVTARLISSPCLPALYHWHFVTSHFYGSNPIFDNTPKQLLATGLQFKVNFHISAVEMIIVILTS